MTPALQLPRGGRAASPKKFWGAAAKLPPRNHRIAMPNDEYDMPKRP